VAIDTCRSEHVQALVACGEMYVLGPRAFVLMLSRANG
jgi:hypothetical protein